MHAIEPGAAEELVSRRAAIAKGAKTTAFVRAALAIGSAPVALGALAREVYGQAGTPSVTAVLQFALLLENLEAEFYKTVTGAGAGFSATNNPQAAAFATVRGQLTADEAATFALIRDHEIAHVNFLRTALGTNAGAVMTGQNFDFTNANGAGNGPFAAAGTNKAFLLAVTQGLEDTGVRAYKGQAANLISDPEVLTHALRIHSVEARHAAKIRRLRRLQATTPAPETVRLSGTIRGGGAAAAGIGNITGLTPAQSTAATAAFELIYGGTTSEANTTQGAANVAGLTIAGLTGTDLTNAATEAFDEPLTMAEVTNIVKDFVIGNNP
jgi:hypothetical protein